MILKDILLLKNELELHKKYKSEYTVLNRILIIETVRNFLKEIDNSVGKNNKLDGVRRLYSFLIVNKKFVISEPKFKQSVKMKLKEFYESDNWLAASEIYHFYLFDETIEGKFVNFESDESFSDNLGSQSPISFKTTIPDKFENLFEEIIKLDEKNF